MPTAKKHPTELALSRRPEMLGEAQRDLTGKRSKVRGSDPIRLPSNTLKTKLTALAASSETVISGAREGQSSAEAQTNSYLLLE